MSRRSIFLVVSLVASVGLLPTAAVANVPNNEAATYRLVTPIPNIGEAPNGDHAAIQVTQPFFFSVHPKSVSGGGTFTHTFTGGSFSTTWTATELLSFQPFGCGIAGDGTPRPPNFCGGRVEMAISIATRAATGSASEAGMTSLRRTFKHSIRERDVRRNRPGVRDSARGDGAFMEPSGRSQWQSAAIARLPKPQNKPNSLPSVATSCLSRQMVRRVSGSSPEEGSATAPHVGAFSFRATCSSSN